MKLAWIHFENISSQRGVTTQQFDPELETMYKEAIMYEKLDILNKKISVDFHQKYVSNQQVENLVATIDKYGKGYMVRCQNLEDICER